MKNTIENVPILFFSRNSGLRVHGAPTRTWEEWKKLCYNWRRMTYLVDIATVSDHLKPFILQHYCLSLLGECQFIRRHPNYHVHLWTTGVLQQIEWKILFVSLNKKQYAIQTSLLGKAFLACFITFAWPWNSWILSLYIQTAHRMEQIKDAVDIHSHSSWGLVMGIRWRTSRLTKVAAGHPPHPRPSGWWSWGCSRFLPSPSLPLDPWTWEIKMSRRSRSYSRKTGRSKQPWSLSAIAENTVIFHPYPNDNSLWNSWPNYDSLFPFSSQTTLLLWQPYLLY